VRAIWNGITIAHSNATLLVEGNHYFPPDSVADGYLERSALRSLCPWKGIAAYYHLGAEDARGPNAAWTYRHPLPWIRKIKGHVAFAGAVEVRSDQKVTTS